MGRQIEKKNWCLDYKYASPFFVGEGHLSKTDRKTASSSLLNLFSNFFCVERKNCGLKIKEWVIRKHPPKIGNTVCKHQNHQLNKLCQYIPKKCPDSFKNRPDARSLLRASRSIPNGLLGAIQKSRKAKRGVFSTEPRNWSKIWWNVINLVN